MHRYLLVSSVSKTSPSSSLEASSPQAHVADPRNGRGNLSEWDQALHKFPNDVCKAAQGLPGASQTLNCCSNFNRSSVGYSSWLVSRAAIWRMRTSQNHRMSWAGRAPQGSWCPAPDEISALSDCHLFISLCSPITFLMFQRNFHFQTALIFFLLTCTLHCRWISGGTLGCFGNSRYFRSDVSIVPYSCLTRRTSVLKVL